MLCFFFIITLCNERGGGSSLIYEVAREPRIMSEGVASSIHMCLLYSIAAMR